MFFFNHCCHCCNNTRRVECECCDNRDNCRHGCCCNERPCMQKPPCECAQRKVNCRCECRCNMSGGGMNGGCGRGGDRYTEC